MVRLGLGCRIH
ncbi:unnamed protein product, partial [Didymodactylos carnosus]